MGDFPHLAPSPASFLLGLSQLEAATGHHTEESIWEGCPSPTSPHRILVAACVSPAVLPGPSPALVTSHSPAWSPWLTAAAQRPCVPQQLWPFPSDLLMPLKMLSLIPNPSKCPVPLGEMPVPPCAGQHTHPRESPQCLCLVHQAELRDVACPKGPRGHRRVRAQPEGRGLAPEAER